MRYIRIYNHDTGQQVVLDTYEVKYRKLGMAFLNQLRMKPAFVKHLILTQREENYYPRILDPFFHSVRRYYGEVSYIWTVEVQKRGVLHWHILMAFPYGTYFSGDDIRRIQSYWKYGNVAVRPVRTPSLSYIMKYITKSLTCYVARIRRIGSSFLPKYLRQSWKRLVGFLRSFAGFLDPADCDWDYKGAFLRDEENRKVRIYNYPPTGWTVMWGVSV